MYYKITNKECVIFKKLSELRDNERRIEKENIENIKQVAGLEFDQAYGDVSQQNFRRVPQYSGFVFKNPESANPKIWKAEKEGVFLPNLKYKLGRKMHEFLLNGLKGSNYFLPHEILGVRALGRFKLPFVESFEDVVLVYLDEKLNPSDSNLIEITKREFEETYESKKHEVV